MSEEPTFEDAEFANLWCPLGHPSGFLCMAEHCAWYSISRRACLLALAATAFIHAFEFPVGSEPFPSEWSGAESPPAYVHDPRD